jgi:hypothetical protein
VIELGEFHEAEAERFGKPVRVAKRIVGIERDVIDPARAGAGDVAAAGWDARCAGRPVFDLRTLAVGRPAKGR